jgi:hypothetical protein
MKARMYNLLEVFRQPVYDLIDAGSKLTLKQLNNDVANADQQQVGHPIFANEKPVERCTNQLSPAHQGRRA